MAPIYFVVGYGYFSTAYQSFLQTSRAPRRIVVLSLAEGTDTF